VAFDGFDCTRCRAEGAADGQLPPCEARGACHLEPSPGDAELLPENVVAVELWARLRVVGEAVWQLSTLEFTPAEADLLLTQLHELSTYHAYLERCTQTD
jgi:hypothetical protein